jgi:hypothetical protein
MKSIILGLLLLLIGCSDKENQDSFRNEPEYYKCTVSELEIVIKESDYCLSKTNYKKWYCFLQAKKSQCTFVGKKKRKKRK